jgi:hypothetical protein
MQFIPTPFGQILPSPLGHVDVRYDPRDPRLARRRRVVRSGR